MTKLLSYSMKYRLVVESPNIIINAHTCVYICRPSKWYAYDSIMLYTLTDIAITSWRDSLLQRVVLQVNTIRSRYIAIPTAAQLPGPQVSWYIGMVVWIGRCTCNWLAIQVERHASVNLTEVSVRKVAVFLGLPATDIMTDMVSSYVSRSIYIHTYIHKSFIKTMAERIEFTLNKNVNKTVNLSINQSINQSVSE